MGASITYCMVHLQAIANHLPDTPMMVYGTGRWAHFNVKLHFFFFLFDIFQTRNISRDHKDRFCDSSIKDLVQIKCNFHFFSYSGSTADVLYGMDFEEMDIEIIRQLIRHIFLKKEVNVHLSHFQTNLTCNFQKDAQ